MTGMGLWDTSDRTRFLSFLCESGGSLNELIVFGDLGGVLLVGIDDLILVKSDIEVLKLSLYRLSWFSFSMLLFWLSSLSRSILCFPLSYFLYFVLFICECVSVTRLSTGCHGECRHLEANL